MSHPVLQLSVPGLDPRQLLALELHLRHRAGACRLHLRRAWPRTHVNIFIGDERIVDRRALSDQVLPDSRVSILQALSGG